MSFRRRNVAIADARAAPAEIKSSPAARLSLPGTRPSTADGRRVTSTGIVNLDSLFAGHGGLPLGTSCLLEESGTTDYAGSLLRFFAAEGLVQEHHVHVVGLPEQWGRELPGLSSSSKSKQPEMPHDEKMKIAWRYERLGQHGSDRARDDQVPPSDQRPFCHTFDLSKRLIHPANAQIKYYRLMPGTSPFASLSADLNRTIDASSPDVVHRVIVPSLMSPALYPQTVCRPEQVLSFQHSLRKILASYPTRVVVLQTLPLSLFPRSSGLTKWTEILSDGVFTLTPFPHSADAEFQTQRDPTTKEEGPQGLLTIQKLPLFHERGIGVAPADTDWTFSLSRRKLTIKPFNLPPIEGDTEAQEAASSSGDASKPKAADLEF